MDDTPNLISVATLIEDDLEGELEFRWNRQTGAHCISTKSGQVVQCECSGKLPVLNLEPGQGALVTEAFRIR